MWYLVSSRLILTRLGRRGRLIVINRGHVQSITQVASDADCTDSVSQAVSLQVLLCVLTALAGYGYAYVARERTLQLEFGACLRQGLR